MVKGQGNDEFLANLVKDRKKKKEEEKEKIMEVVKEIEVIKEVHIQVIPHENLSLTFEITPDKFNEITEKEELKNYLKEKSTELLSVEGTRSILQGKILCEVAKKIEEEEKSEIGYGKFLEINGLKKDTALRLRKRYELFEKAKTIALKQIISLLPVRELETLYKNEALFEEMNSDEKIIYKVAVELIHEDSSEQNKLEDKSINVEQEKFDFEELLEIPDTIKAKYEDLEIEKKKKVNKLLLEIKKIIENQ